MNRRALLTFLILLWGLFLPLAGRPGSGDSTAPRPARYNLARLLQLCFEHNMDLRAAGLKISAQLARVRKAKAKGLPSITFTGVYSRIGVVPKFEIPGFEEIDFVNPDMINLTLGAQYPLLDWGMTRDAVAIEKLGLKSRRLNALMAKKGCMLQVAVLYDKILQLGESRAVLGRNIALMDEILALLRERFAAGIIPEHPILQTVVAKETLEARRLALRQIEENLSVALKNVTGLPLDRAIRLEPVDRETGIAVPGKQEATARALDRREDLTLIATQLNILEKTRDILGKSRLPLVNASLNAELRNGIMPRVERLKTNWNIGLTVVYNLFDGGATRYEKEALSHEIEALRLGLEKLGRNVRADLETLYTNLALVEREIAVEKRRLAVAERALDLARQSFKESRAGYLEVLQARADYNLAENNLVELKYRRYDTFLQIEFASGSLEDVLLLLKEEK